MDDQDNTERLKKLGMTDLDIAIFKDDVENVDELSKEHQNENNFELAKSYRMLRIADQESEVLKNEITLQGEKMPLSELSNYIYVSDTLSENSTNINKSLLIWLEDTGQRNNDITTWDYNFSNASYKVVSTKFDASVILGNSVIDLSMLENPEEIGMSFKRKVYDLQLKYSFNQVLTMINMHDAGKGQGKLQESMDFIAAAGSGANSTVKEYICIIDSCHSGQYHTPESQGRDVFEAKTPEEKEKNLLLITSSADNQTSLTGSFKPEEFEKITAVSVESISQFYSTWSGSTPHISGQYNGRYYPYQPVKEFYEANFTTKETSSSAEEDSISILDEEQINTFDNDVSI